ncbi:MAG: hypothetical protein WAW12_10205, partial [Pseudomonas sp.]
MNQPLSSASTLHVRPWLARLHPGLFAIPLGILGLDGAWQHLAALSIRAAQPTAKALLAGGLALLALLSLLWLGKALRHSSLLKREFFHPVQGPLLALWPVSILLAVSQLAPLYPGAKAGLLTATLLALLLQGMIAWQVVKQLATGQMPEELVTPVLYLPIVPGGL